MDENTDGILAALPEAVIEVGLDQRIRGVNAMAEKIFGYPAQELIGQPLNMLIPEPYHDTHHRHVSRFAGSSDSAHLMHARQHVTGRRRDHSLFPAEASIVKGKRDGKQMLVAILRDVSERAAQRARLVESERKQRAIMDCCPDAIMIVDAVTGLIKEVNQATTTLTGQPAEALINTPEAALHAEPEVSGLMKALEQSSAPDALRIPDTLLRHADGSLVPVEIIARRIELQGQRLLACFYRSIGHFKEREARLRDALHDAALASRTRTLFLANMSHELRTPLNGIIGFAQMIAMDIHGSSGSLKYPEYGRLISLGAEHLLSLVNDVLDLSALDSGNYSIQPEQMALLPLIEECRSLLLPLIDRGKLNVEISVPDSQFLWADRRALRQMVINLLGNAAKFTPEHGRIFIRSGTEQGTTWIAVEDNGRGIEPDRLLRVLEPFNVADTVYTRTHGGAGLGLSITRMLAELHGGRLTLDSSVGKGTRATLWLPDRERAPKPAGTRTAPDCAISV